ncbi:hypothetical protein [Hyperthermus butylicus]|uniref:Uncharacterized protein n=1 Tax=Hyperthermus butylicus (strain DSM 5456 / JCM 9403 / PLM1-5) TaxID=415426 RepID=A2BKV1_HYPBU|nr:hypothetical protein [Hyperthermus butylicus]ABM80612.1 hypothetical protein Hbut_0758 [Hyperthermus butylicus DSM 5456]
MSMQVTVKYDEVREALQTLTGLKLRGNISGPPTSRLPLRRIVEDAMKPRIAAVEEYRGSRIVAVKIDDSLYLVCHFGLDQPDDFCIALEGENAWQRVAEAADKLSRKMNESYTLTLSAIIHALQGIITGEEEEVEEITDPDQVIEELLTWLPEYIAVVE